VVIPGKGAESCFAMRVELALFCEIINIVTQIASKILSSLSFWLIWLIFSMLPIISIDRCIAVESTSSKRRKPEGVFKKLSLWKRRTEHDNFANFPLLDHCVSKIEEVSGIGNISIPGALTQAIVRHLDELAFFRRIIPQQSHIHHG